MWIVWVLLSLLLAYAAVIVYFYFFAFVKLKQEDTDNLESKINKVLEPYFDVIRAGYSYIDSCKPTWVYAESHDNLKLAARYFPCGSSKRTMILFHGYRSSAKRDFACAVKMYHDMGLNVLLCDQRSHGRSKGRLITFGVKERFDVVTWIEYVLKNFGEDTEIFLGGMSMGATTVLLSAGLEETKLVKGIVADCGFTSPYEIIDTVARRSYHVSAVLLFWAFDIISRMFGNFSLSGHSTVDVMKTSQIPVFFIHGESDSFVPVEMSKAGYEAAVCEKNILIVPEADHGFSYLKDETAVIKKVGEFIRSH